MRGRLVQQAQVDGGDVSPELPGLTFGEALRTRQFWGMCTQPELGPGLLLPRGHCLA